MVKLAVWSAGSMVSGASNCMMVTRLSGGGVGPQASKPHATSDGRKPRLAERKFQQAGAHFNSFRAASTVVRTVVGSVTVLRYS